MEYLFFCLALGYYTWAQLSPVCQTLPTYGPGVYLLDLFSFIPGLSSVVRFLVSLLVFIAMWIGVAIAHKLKSWRTLILPIVYIMVFLLSFVIIYTVIGGLTLALESLGIDLGLLSPP